MTTAVLAHDRRNGLGIGQLSSPSTPATSSSAYATLHMPHSSTPHSHERRRSREQPIETQHVSIPSPQGRRSSEVSVEGERRLESDNGERTGGSSRAMTDRKEHNVRSADDAGHPSSSYRAGRPSSPSSNISAKRTYSQTRSPSRPRSQQGSQAAQIASVKEAERENAAAAAAGRFVRRHHHDAFVDEYDGHPDQARKAPRLARDTPSAPDDGVYSDWSRARRLSQISESPNSDRMNTLPKMRVSHATAQHDNGEDTMAIDPSRRSAARHYTGEAEANYTWNQRAADRDADMEEGSGDLAAGAESVRGASPPSRFAHAPISDSRMLAPSSAPPSTLPQSQRLTADRRSAEDRSPSPPPRLPGISALGSYNAAHGTQRRLSINSPTQQSYHNAQSQQVSGNVGGGRPRVSSFGMPAFANASSAGPFTSPRGGPAPSSMSAHSPSLSQTSHTTPGQAFIHPSLAGLPGAGGGVGSKQQPSFVSKLYSMLEDDTIEDMIAWTPSGTTFSVANPAEFARVVLPNWFKHSNWQSFVRQLNMYGFHKVNHTYQGTPEEEIQVWEFKHSSFRRGEVQLLGEIKRKSSRHKRQDSLTMSHVHEYDMTGRSPSPDLGGGGGMMHPSMPPSGHHATGMVTAGSTHGYPHGAPVQHSQPAHPQQQHGAAIAAPGAYGRSAAATSSHATPYRDHYGVEYGAEAANDRHGRSHSHMAGAQPSQPTGSVVRGDEHWAAMPGSSSVQHHHPQQHSKEDVYVSGGAMKTASMVSAEVVSGRMDDLSDRIDAIIRHATYLEGQVRSLSDQLFHTQQNESSLRTHVHHLESQMRSLSDQLYQQRHGGGAAGTGGQQPPASPLSSSAARMHQQGGGGVSTTTSPNMQLNPGAPTANTSGRFSSSMSVARSPVIGAHPSYGVARGPPAQSGPTSSYDVIRGSPASSADAYTRLGPPSSRGPQPKSEHHM